MSRSLLGRTSFLWAAGFVVLIVLWAASLWAEGVRPPSAHDLDYVVVHGRGALFNAALFVLIGVTYFVLEQARRGPMRRLLGGLHTGATFLGVVISWGAFVALLKFETTGLGAFRFWGGVASSGYVMTLVGQLFFVAVLIDAFRREPNPR
jgi:hypothetical protein